MKVSRLEYFNSLKALYEDWRLKRFRREIPTENDEASIKLRATIEFYKKHDHVEELLEKLNSTESDEISFSYQLELLALQLMEDLKDYINKENHERFDLSYIGFLPTGKVGAFCLNKTAKNELLDGYLICINEGLYLAIQILSRAFVTANFDHDYLKYRRSGQDIYQNAIKYYLDPNPNSSNEMFFVGLPPVVDGEATAIQSSMATLIHIFIGLHEFGHIINDDLELMDEYGIQLIGSDSHSHDYHKHWEAEFKADLYALRMICARSSDFTSSWANFITIYVFFNWLADVEKQLGSPICRLHPPPEERAIALRKWMTDNIGETEQIKSFFISVDSIIKQWRV